jgi:hypothetical protein
MTLENRWATMAISTLAPAESQSHVKMICNAEIPKTKSYRDRAVRQQRRMPDDSKDADNESSLQHRLHRALLIPPLGIAHPAWFLPLTPEEQQG